MIYLTHRVPFSASHVLNGFPHGHNYILEVTLRGEPDPRTGVFLDSKHLTETIETRILSQVNYKHLDERSSFLEGNTPTAENLVKAFWKTLEEAFPRGALYEIKLQKLNEIVSFRGEP